MSFLSRFFSTDRVPLLRTLSADLDTPLSVYLKLAENQPYSYLLESVQGPETWGRYSIIGLSAHLVLRVTGHTIVCLDQGHVAEQLTVKNPFEWLQLHLKLPAVLPSSLPPELPRFCGGYVGYLGYDVVRQIEPRLAEQNKPDPIGTPDMLFMRSEDVVVFDNFAGKLYLLTYASPNSPKSLAEANARLAAWTEKLHRPVSIGMMARSGALQQNDLPWNEGCSQMDFESAVLRAKDYIASGDIMQVVLSQRLSRAYGGSPLSFYRALRTLNPSPYLYCFHLDDFHIVGSSPEILARVSQRSLTVRPIAGTRKRDADPVKDRALEQELLADPKERAEHIMLVDLGRNDVGRVAETGSVEITRYMEIERYSHVMHIVSEVTGRLREDVGLLDAFAATFPAGTLTGAPKIRAMEIIDELEPVKRGVYGGAVGYFSFSGNMDFAIAIRTAVIKEGRIHVQAGAGIVADSLPEGEWEETMNKANAACRAAGLAGE